MPDSRGKNYLINLVDTPGHPSFCDEVTVGMRLADSVLLVIDCIEGVTLAVEKQMQEAMRSGLKITVFLNKLDRLVLELKLPPGDAYFKLKNTLDELNLLIKQYDHCGTQDFLSPLADNVVFGSTLFESCFTLKSFSQRYVKSDSFAKFMWGDLYYDEHTRKFTRQNQDSQQRSFVQFILEPFYKLISFSISNEKEQVSPILKRYKVTLKNSEYALDMKPMLKLILSRIFGDLACLVDMIAKTPSAQ